MLQDKQADAAATRRSLLGYSDANAAAGAAAAHELQPSAESGVEAEAGAQQDSGADAAGAADAAGDDARGLHYDLDTSNLPELSAEDVQLLSAVLPKWAVQQMHEESNGTWRFGDSSAAASSSSARGVRPQASRRLSYIEGVKDVSTLEYKIAPHAKHLWGQQASKQCVICHGCQQVGPGSPALATRLAGDAGLHSRRLAPAATTRSR
jgi:hypothetical protein